MSDSLKIIGAHGERRPNDFYPTPPECTIALLDFLEADGKIHRSVNVWEPACGDGAIVDVLRKRGYAVMATDILTGTDFMTAKKPAATEWIITNPPFSLAEKFIQRALWEWVPFAFLLKSQFWHSKRRQDLFHRMPPDFVLPLTWRPDFTGKGASMMDVCWNVWLNDRRSGLFTLYIPLERPARMAEEGEA